jgi:hypothetical protein
MKITSYKELNEQLRVYQLEVDGSVTFESVKSKTPRQKQITRTITLPTQYSREISLELLQDWITMAKNAGAETLRIDPTVYDGEFEDHEVSYNEMVDETEEDYNIRLQYQYKDQKARLIAQKKYDLEKALSEYQKYEELKRQFEGK